MNGVKVTRTETFRKGNFAATLVDGQSGIDTEGLAHRNRFTVEELRQLRDVLDEAIRVAGTRLSGHTLPVPPEIGVPA